MAAVSITGTKFAVVAGSLYVSAIFNGHATQAIIDTGASVSAVSPALASRENLKEVGNVQVSGDTRSSNKTLVGPSTVGLGATNVILPRVIVTDLSFVGQTGFPVDLIIGQDVLSRVNAHFDFAHSKITYSPPGHQRTPGDGYSRLDLSRDKSGRYIINVNFGDGDEQEAVLDFGNNSPVLMSNEFANRKGFDNIFPRSTGLIATISGITETECFRIPKISIGGFPLVGVPVDSIKGWISPPYLNIGLPILSNFSIDLDLGYNSIWIKPDNPTAIDQDMSGSLFEYRFDRLKVVHVAKHSPAEEAGLNVGDIITEVDGKPIDSSYYTSNLWRWRLGPQGKKVPIIVNGYAKILILRRYY